MQLKTTIQSNNDGSRVTVACAGRALHMHVSVCTHCWIEPPAFNPTHHYFMLCLTVHLDAQQLQYGTVRSVLVKNRPHH